MRVGCSDFQNYLVKRVQLHNRDGSILSSCVVIRCFDQTQLCIENNVQCLNTPPQAILCHNIWRHQPATPSQLAILKIGVNTRVIEQQGSRQIFQGDQNTAILFINVQQIVEKKIPNKMELLDYKVQSMNSNPLVMCVKICISISEFAFTSMKMYSGYIEYG